ncbi:hypothetical protein D8B26_003932 [Coccidioides posadasii str. Silveira]|uniref:4-carboxymuconolactone decarboxylase n=2 Tax=Coccidioides posadasii TaxID=199306 RepID=E9D9F3_COCPS|nr:4-carboxymuconolactone decarboxylase [Coccidioides posadasii str. Silveira]KMM70097.1 hypothetical protein CPAG_06409 [Coccidioides posadasii RMSCC 3488]QVM09268.1 hypothetical protein D8B26_003932 [Coccidioides posadasii str. Silveira]
MKIPYAPNPPQTSNDEEKAILQRVLDRRGEAGLLPLDLALLHSFPVADGWNTFLGAIRTRTSLPVDIREITICRVATLNEAWFEWKHHAPFLAGVGFTEGMMEMIKDAKTPTDAELGALFSRKQAAVFRYTEAMTRTVKVPDAIFAEMKGLFSEKEIVEITATAAAYNCVSRVLVALDVGEMNK